MKPAVLVQRLEALRTELADRAFTLERHGRFEAADVAMELRSRLAELGAEFVAGTKPADRPGEPACFLAPRSR